MKIALFSRSIYPRTGGSSFVTEQLAKNFSRNQLFVIGGRDVIFFKTIIRPRDSPSFFYLPSQISFKGRGERFFELIRLLLFPINLIHSLIILRREKPGVIVAVFPDAHFCCLALICARIMGKPFYTYFHNTYKENRFGFKRLIASFLQNIFFDTSLLIFVMSDGLKKFYEEAHPSIRKFTTLPHTHQHSARVEASLEGGSSLEVNVAFTGNFNESNLDSTIRTVNALKKLPNIKLNFYTPVPKTLLKFRGVDTEAIEYKGYLEEEEYRRSLAMNDVMILTHGLTGGYSLTEYETIFPTRTIELLLTGKPIFVHAPVRSFLAKFLHHHGCACVVTDADEDILRAKFMDLCKDPKYRQSLVLNARKASLLFYGPQVIEQWIRQIEKSLEQ